MAEKPTTSHQQQKKRCRLPGPRGAPFAWAESRQELCETLLYYRAYHSGCYTCSAKLTSSNQKRKAGNLERDCTPYGYLLAGFGTSRDAWEHQGRVIISHGGGKSGKEDGSKRDVDSTLHGIDETATSTDDDYTSHPIGDQTLEDGQISALVQSHQCQTPIVLLIAKDYKLSHFELNCAFAVLGWYWITDFWCEREPSKDDVPGWVRWKFRFQYIQSQGHPWWLGDDRVPFWSPASSQSTKGAATTHTQSNQTDLRHSNDVWSSGKRIQRPAHLSNIVLDEGKNSKDPVCYYCRQSSPSVFRIGWMCLSQGCEAFWKLSDGALAEGALLFDTDFLKLRHEPLHFIHGGLPFSLLPLASATHSSAVDQGDTMRGLHCTCGRLTCRRYDHYWHCASCGFIKPCQAASKIHKSPSIGSFSGLESSKVHSTSGIKTFFTTIPSDNIAVTSFYFPKELGAGDVHLIESIDGNQSEADGLFEAMQKGPEWGMTTDGQFQPYYSNEVIPFRRHPLSCHSVKGDLLSQQFTCNYGAEYKHSVKMGTVFLDEAPSCIKIALNLITERTRKVIPSSNGNNNDDFNEVYPVKYKETQKMNFHDDGEPGLGPTVSSLSLGMEARMVFRLKEKYVVKADQDDIKKKESVKGITMATRNFLTLTLRHGCVVIQHGRQLQEFIEHAVQPVMGAKQRGDDGIRIAVTARRIDQINTDVQTQQRSKKRKTLKVQSVMKFSSGILCNSDQSSLR